MRILLDCDGVLADFVGPVLRESGAVLRPEDIDRWDLFSLMQPDVRERAFEILRKPEFWRAQPLIPGAAEGVEQLRAGGHEIYFVTSPWKDCAGWGKARRAWLEEHFDVDPDHVVITASKWLCVGDLLVDDSFSNIEAFAREHGAHRVRLFDAPYNKSLVGSHDYQRTRWPELGRLGGEGI